MYENGLLTLPKGLQREAFTLMELMIVVVVIAIIAAFAVPNYQKSVERAHLRDAITQLQAVNAANQIYRARDGAYWPTVNGQDITSINTNLGLNIIANGMTYNCDGNGTIFSCTAVRNGAVPFTVTVTEAVLSGANPSCTAGACP